MDKFLALSDRLAYHDIKCIEREHGCYVPIRGGTGVSVKDPEFFCLAAGYEVRVEDFSDDNEDAAIELAEESGYGGLIELGFKTEGGWFGFEGRPFPPKFSYERRLVRLCVSEVEAAEVLKAVQTLNLQEELT